MKSTQQKVGWLKKVVILIYVISVILWIIFIVTTKNIGTYEGPIFNYVLTPFLIGMTILPLFGFILCVQKAQLWGGWKSAIGKSLISLGLGLLGWAGGMIVWNYYLFFKEVEVPFPSLADLFFITIWPLWTFSMLQLSKATGAKYGFRKVKGKVIAVIIAVVSIFLSYYLLFVVAKEGIIDLSLNTPQIALNFFYPIGDVAILMSAILVYALSYKFLGGLYKKTVIILLVGFLINYVADFIFLFTSTKGTYFNGHIVDFMYLTMMFTLSLGVAGFNSPEDKVKNIQ